MIATREICKKCGNINRIGYHVPDEIWNQVIWPSENINIIYCLDCFTKIADEKMIEWDKDIQFYPVSFVSHLNYNIDKKININN